MFNKLTPLGIRIPDGFAVTSTAYRHFLKTNQLEKPLEEILGSLDSVTLQNLPDVGKRCRDLLAAAAMPVDLDEAIREAYRTFAASELEGFRWPFAAALRLKTCPLPVLPGNTTLFSISAGKTLWWPLYKSAMCPCSTTGPSNTAWITALSICRWPCL